MKTKLYRCDPEKNKDCLANYCYKNDGPCMRTTQKKYKMDISKRLKEFFKGGKNEER